MNKQYRGRINYQIQRDLKEWESVALLRSAAAERTNPKLYIPDNRELIRETFRDGIIVGICATAAVVAVGMIVFV